MSPFRTARTIQSWLDEFVALGYPLAGDIRVLEQDGADGGNTGLVGVGLANATTHAYIQPLETGSPLWVVTMQARESDLALRSSDLVKLASELVTLGALCAFLEAKSLAALADLPESATGS